MQKIALFITIIAFITVRGVFDSVATRYDLMNDAMSLYAQRHWKHHFVRQLPLSRVPSVNGQQRYIDVAAG